MGLARQRRLFTAQEYLKRERDASYKSEFVDGEIYAMAGASPGHNTICLNIGGLLWMQLEGTPCQAFPSDLRTAVSSDRMYTYPDISVVCGEPVFSDSGDNLTNPRVIFEILSPSTEDYDRGEKFEKYKQIASLTDYVLVAQDRPLIEHYLRDAAGEWSSFRFEGLDAELKVDSIACVLPFARVYSRVWSAAPAT